MQWCAWRAGRLGTEMRQRNSTDQKNRITLIASFDSHCIFTEGTPPTQLSVEGRSCITAKQCPCVLCWTSTRRRRGLTCARMSARREHPGGFARDDPPARHAACTPCICSSFNRTVAPSWEASLETLLKQKANQPDGVTVSTTVVFVTGFWCGRGQDETHRQGDAGTPQFVFVVVCFAVFTALVPLHRETLADIRRQFVRDLVLQDERSDEVVEYDRQVVCYDRHKAVYTEVGASFSVSWRQTSTRKNATTADQRTLGGYRRQRGKNVKIMSSKLFFQTPSVQPFLVLSL